MAAVSKFLDNILESYLSLQPRPVFDKLGYKTIPSCKLQTYGLNGCFDVLTFSLCFSLNVTTMIKVWNWERFQFKIYHENQQVCSFVSAQAYQYDPC